MKWILSLFLFTLSLVAGQENAQVPAVLLANALNFVVSSSGSSISSSSISSSSSRLNDENDTISTIIQKLNNGDVETLYSVATSMNTAGDHINSVLIWHALADGPSHHIMSMVRLGFSYAQEDKTQAIKYFAQAGEDGPHQAALYNAGRLFLEANNDLTRAMAYIRAAATLGHNKNKRTAKFATPQITQTATQAYEMLSNMLITDVRLDLENMVNIFEYASMDDFPIQGSREHKLWDGAMMNLSYYMGGISRDQKTLTRVSDNLARLQNSKNLSELQVVLLRNILVEILKLVKEEEL